MPYHTMVGSLRKVLPTVQFSSVIMLVGIWLGLYRVLFSFFDRYIQSSVQFPGEGALS